MDLSIKTEAFAQDDQSWLGSAHGTQSARSVTLDVASFVEATHYPDGYLPSGIALALIAGSGDRYGPYDPANTTTEPGVLVGFLLSPLDAPKPGSTSIAGALLDHGRVRTDRLPFQTGTGSADAAGQADVTGQIVFV